MSTKQERQVAKAKVTVARRAAHYQQRINAAKTPKSQLSEACQFLRAVADGLPEREVKALATQVVALANGRNKA